MRNNKINETYSISKIMYDIDNLSCIIRAETLHIANDDQRIQTGKEREREEGRERKSEREKRERKKTRTSRLAHGGLIRSSLLTLLPAARLLCTDGERERARARTREKERDRERERATTTFTVTQWYEFSNETHGTCLYSPTPPP